MNEFISLLSRILLYDFMNKIESEAAQAQSTNLESKSDSNTSYCIQENNIQQHLPRNSILKNVLDFQLLAQVFHSYNTNILAFFN